MGHFHQLFAAENSRNNFQQAWIFLVEDMLGTILKVNFLDDMYIYNFIIFFEISINMYASLNVDYIYTST